MDDQIRPRFEYVLREFPDRGSFCDEPTADDGWAVVFEDNTDQGHAVLYRRVSVEGQDTADTIPPPAMVAAGFSKHIGEKRDVHRAAYYVRRVLSGESVAGVDERLSHDYRIVHAVISALKESRPLTVAAGVVGGWRRKITAHKHVVETLNAAPEYPDKAKQIDAVTVMIAQIEALADEMDQALSK